MLRGRRKTPPAKRLRARAAANRSCQDAMPAYSAAPRLARCSSSLSPFPLRRELQELVIAVFIFVFFFEDEPVRDICCLAVVEHDNPPRPHIEQRPIVRG